MSIHSSLRGADSLKGERSVLKRVERIEKLAKDGKFDSEEDSVWGIPKVRTKFKVVSAKKAKEKAEAAAAAEAEAAGEGAETPEGEDAKAES
jgi:small basic protein (TIGR04137 family)